MIVSPELPRLEADRVVLSARVEPRDGEPVDLWYRLPPGLGAASHDASPFFAALLLWCMRTREPLVVRGPVSPRLLDAADGLMDVYRAFWPRLVSRIDVDADPAEPSPGPRLRAAFFSRGVDSWYTALRDSSLTHHVFVPNLDWMYDDTRRLRAEHETRRVTESLGRELLVVETNLRHLAEPTLHHGYYHGATLASVGLALGVARAVIPGHRSYGEMNYGELPEGAPAAGCDPVLDPRFSTETTEIIHSGADATRLEKVQYLGRSELALSSLKVCFEDNLDGNCGRCSKCVSTMLELHVTGNLAKVESFERSLDPRHLARFPFAEETSRTRMLDVLERLGSTQFDRRLAEAIHLRMLKADLLRARRRARRIVGSWDRRVLRGALHAAAGLLTGRPRR